LIAATTRISLLSSPLRSRFGGGVFRLEFYSPEEIGKIIKRSADILGIQIVGTAVEEIAKRSRRTPRTANYLLKRTRDFAQVKKVALSKEVVDESLKLLQIDDMGLTFADRAILDTIINKFGGGPVGVNTIAAALGEEPSTIEEFNEPYLMQIGFIERTQRGREATESAYKHLNIVYEPKKLF